MLFTVYCRQMELKLLTILLVASCWGERNSVDLRTEMVTASGIGVSHYTAKGPVPGTGVVNPKPCTAERNFGCSTGLGPITFIFIIIGTLSPDQQQKELPEESGGKATPGCSIRLVCSWPNYVPGATVIFYLDGDERYRGRSFTLTIKLTPENSGNWYCTVIAPGTGTGTSPKVIVEPGERGEVVRITQYRTGNQVTLQCDIPIGGQGLFAIFTRKSYHQDVRVDKGPVVPDGSRFIRKYTFTATSMTIGKYMCEAYRDNIIIGGSGYVKVIGPAIITTTTPPIVWPTVFINYFVLRNLATITCSGSNIEYPNQQYYVIYYGGTQVEKQLCANNPAGLIYTFRITSTASLASYCAITLVNGGEVKSTTIIIQGMKVTTPEPPIFIVKYPNGNLITLSCYTSLRGYTYYIFQGTNMLFQGTCEQFPQGIAKEIQITSDQALSYLCRIVGPGAPFPGIPSRPITVPGCRTSVMKGQTYRNCNYEQ